MAELLVGLDLGTSSVKAVLVTPEGRTVARAARPLAVQRPHPGWAEQHPDDWLAAAADALAEVASAPAAGDSIAAVGCTGQMDGPVLLDDGGAFLGPVALWCDVRCGAEVEAVHDVVRPADLLAATGKPATTGYTVPKLLWERRHRPERLVAARRWVLPKDVLVAALTGSIGTDPSDASNTLLLDLSTRDWNRGRAETLGLDPGQLPPLRESASVVEGVTARGAAWSGLPEGTPVIAGGGDSPCAALGSGLADARTVQLVLGSAGNVNVVGFGLPVDPAGRVHAGAHLFPGETILTGVQQAAGASLRWWAAVCGLDETALLDEVARTDGPSPTDGPSLTGGPSRSPETPANGGLGGTAARGLARDGTADDVSSPGDAPFFAPYLSGERTPHLDERVRGAFTGLGAGCGRADLTRAVLEGVAFAFRDGRDVLAELGIAPGRLVLAGGGGRHPAWRQALADGLGLELAFVEAEAGWETARGAAALAGIGVGAVGRPGSPSDWAAGADVTRPRADATGRHAAWRRLYPALAGLARPPPA